MTADGRDGLVKVCGYVMGHPRNRPIAGATVRVPAMPGRESHTQHDGYFCFYLTPGNVQYLITVEANGWEGREAMVRVGRDVRYDFLLRPRR